MADVNVSFGLDAGELFSALKNVSSATTQTLNKLEQDSKKLGDSMVTNMAKGTGGIAQSKRELTGFIEENKKALQAMQLNGESGTKAYKVIEDQVKKAQAEVSKIDDAAKKVDASLSGIGDGGAGAGKLGGIFDSLTAKVPGLGGAVGNLGGSFQQLAGGVTGLVPGLGSLTGVLAGGGIVAGVAAVGAGISYAVEKGMEFETQLASLSSITGVSGAGLQDLGAKAQSMAAKFGTDASANIDAFKTILSKLGPDIAKSPEALNSMAESVNTLSKATGDDPGKATEALTGALLQFGVSLDDPVKAADAMAVAMNVLAAGAKEGASEVPDVAAAINVAGVAASKSKVSFEETNSAIQILAAGGKVGAEAGTSLRNVLNKLGEGRFLPKDTATELKKAGVDINKLGDTTITFSERLRELKKISGDAALTTKLFGTDSAAASILIKGASGNMDTLTQKLTGTNTATEQAAINMATFGETINRIKSNIDNFAIDAYNGFQMAFGMLAQSTGPAVTELLTNMGGYFERMWSVVKPILAYWTGVLMIGLSNAINLVSNTLNAFYELAVYAFDGLVNAIKPLYDAIMGALGMDGAAGQSIDVIQILQDVMNTWGAAISAIFDVIVELGKLIIDWIIGSVTNTIKVIIRIGELFVEFGKWIGDLILKIPGVRSVFEGLKSAFDGVYNFFANLPAVINEVQVYLKAVGGTFRSVFGILGEAFDAALNLDFGKAAEKLGSVFESQTWVKAFSNNLQTARNELKTTGEQAQKAGQEFKNFQEQTKGGGTPPPGGDDDKEKEKTKTAETEFQKRKKAYDEFATGLEVARNTEFAKFTEQQKAESETYQTRLKTDASKLNEYLNQQLQKQTTTQFIETPVVIKPQGENESATNIQKFYVDTFLKNKNVVDKIAADQLKDQLKAEAEARKQQVADAEKQYKELSEIIAADIKQNTSAIATAIPNVGALTQAQYDEAVKNAEGYVETLRIKNKFIEDQLVSAQIAGADKAAESLQKQLDANNSLFNSAEQRLNAYVDASAVSLQNSTLANVAALAVQKGLYDVFLNDKTQAEREQLEQARQDKLNALRDEESDLETSLANREISFDEYQQKVATIAEQRRAAEAEGEQGLNNILANLKRAGETALGEIAKTESAKMIKTATDKQDEITKAESDLAAAQRTLNKTKKTDLEAYAKAEADVTEKTKRLADTDAQTYGFRTAVLEEFAGKAIEQFGTLAASGTATIADAGKLAFGVVVELLKKQIPIWVASIFGTTVGQLGPYGVLVAGGLTAALYALANEATAGFKTGGYTGDSGTDEVAGVVHGQEYVLNADATRQNRDVLEWANRTNRPISEYFRSHSLERKTYAVSDSGEIVLEVQKLREETRNLGVQIRRNTVVEVSGNLVGDGRSINAIIENNKRKSIKRG